MAAHHGSDPVLFNVLETNDRILTASMFWVAASNELINHLRKIFNDQQIDISIKSMDSPSRSSNAEEEEEEPSTV